MERIYRICHNFAVSEPNRTATLEAPAAAIPADRTDTAPLLNRELSWLEFNARVLHEAESADNPLIERLKFVAIFDSNLEEFFM